MTRNRIFNVALGIIIILFISKCTSGDKEKDTFSSPRALYVDYISSYTSGLVSRAVPVKVKLTRNVDTASPGEKADEKLLKFDPEIKGEMVWEDARTLVFSPEKPLQSGVEYKSTLNLGALFDTPPDRRSFNFKFETLTQDLEMTISGLELYDEDNLSRAKLTGTILTADFVENQDMEQVLHAEQNGETLKITWDHNEGTHVHRFFVEEVTRGEREEEVALELNGAPIGVSKKEKDEYKVPSLDDYKILNTSIIRGVDNYISVLFSDPLMNRQDLSGLIKLGSMERPPRLVVHMNELKIYPTTELEGQIDLKVFKELKNKAGYQLKNDYQVQLEFTQAKPMVRLTRDDQGVIMPTSENLILPFEAISLKSVQVTIIKIFEDNVLQYLQVNRMGGNYELHRVSRPVLRKTIPLVGGGTSINSKWTRYTLDLSEMFKAEPGAIYRVKIGFRQGDAIFFCPDGQDAELLDSDDFSIEEEEDSYWDDYEDYYYYDDYDWSQRDNPCSASYYGDRRSVNKILFASDLGMIAKRNDQGDLRVFITNLVSTRPISDVNLEVYDYQRQLLSKGTSNAEGISDIPLNASPHFLIARHLNQFGYLKLNDGASLSMSNFNVTGRKIKKGLKGFIYGERGVWRPGDTLRLAFILEDQQDIVPDEQPVILELLNPMGQLYTRAVSTDPVGGIYPFHPATSQDAPTGNWTAKVKAGGTVFQKEIKIETVKPNRLKINFDFGKKQLIYNDKKVSADLNVRWLHGAKAPFLKAEMELLLLPMKTTFDKYPNFSFEDPSREFNSESKVVFQGQLDAEGKTRVNLDLDTEEKSPGALRAVFKTKVFEEGGDFSIDQFGIPYFPYKSFVGIKAPEGDKRGMLLTDKDHDIRIATVDASGNGVSRSNIKVELYKLDWRWWWDSSWENLSYYVGSSYRQPLKTGNIRTTDGEGKWSFRIEYPDWGRYYIRAYDPESGHASGAIVFVDWPGWAGKGKRGDTGGASMLDVTLDKESYNVGEKISLSIPSSQGGRALVSLENGSRILQTFWVETDPEKTQIEFEATRDMAPNFYANISLIQPHAQTVNDLPIRMYGVQNVEVKDPDTKLSPVVEMPAEIRPEQTFKVKVRESNGKPMAYTVAIVDEGLLDLTRFKTPDPWSEFYQREALGVKTWDLYDDVLGAYGGQIQRLLAIGGDDEVKMPDEDKARRFKPVVLYSGPHMLKAGKTAELEFTMPQYVGSVRAMVVAAHEGAYGGGEATTPVKQPLMILATLPRVAGPGEDVVMPVNVFNMSEKQKQVEVTVVTEGRLSVAGAATQKVTVAGSADQMVYFNMKADESLGLAKVTVKASDGSLTANYDVQLDVRASNPPLTDVTDFLVKGGDSHTFDYSPLGLFTTNSGVLEISALPPLNLEKRMRFLVQYPHGCVEQTTSAVFAQLYLDRLTDVDDKMKTRIETNINAAVERLRSFQVSTGGFSYWPGQPTISEWGTNYAGNFLVEAKKNGYYVPEGMFSSWINYQTNQANSWILESTTRDLTQSYRLYTLALCGNPAMGAMNRMKEMKGLSNIARWQLALSYAVVGNVVDAEAIIGDLSSEVRDYRELSGTFGSGYRDRAIILETMTQLGKTEMAFEMIRTIAAYLGDSERWISTQTTAFCLVGIAGYAEKYPSESEMKAKVTIGNNTVIPKTEKFIKQLYLEQPDKKAGIVFENQGEGPLFVRLIRRGIPLVGEESPSESNITMEVRFKDMNGTPIEISNLKQGYSFMAEVSVFNPGIRGLYEELALTQIFPSGWEIINTRLNEVPGQQDSVNAEYVDIRDDRVYHYFDLKANERKVFRVLLNASYRGRYYLPATVVEAMYDNSIHANNSGGWINVTVND